jgi:hypothetical protein
MGWGRPSTAQQLVASQQAVLAVPTTDAGRFRVLQVIKGDQPEEDTVAGGYPRTGPGPGDVTPTESTPLLLIREDPLPEWVILGTIDNTRADWVRALAAGKPAAQMNAEDWSARIALVVPQLHGHHSLATELAYAELDAAPYAALRTAKPLLDTAELRRCMADAEIVEHHHTCLLLLGISGNTQDAAALQKRLQVASQSGDAANLSSMLAADLELGGEARVAWIESNYLTNPKRSTPEIKAALLALSVHGNAKGAISRERVIQSYRLFMKAHPEIAGDVAPDFAAWQYWDAVPEYLALMNSKVRQQYPSHLAMLAYLQQSPNARTLELSDAAPADSKAQRPDTSMPQP